jgi:hypothetical protein
MASIMPLSSLERCAKQAWVIRVRTAVNVPWSLSRTTVLLRVLYGIRLMASLLPRCGCRRFPLAQRTGPGTRLRVAVRG